MKKKNEELIPAIEDTRNTLPQEKKTPRIRRKISKHETPTEQKAKSPRKEKIAESTKTRSTQRKKKRNDIPDTLLILSLRDTVVYPAVIQPLSIGQDQVALIDEAVRRNRYIFFVAQKPARKEVKSAKDFYEDGSLAQIGRTLRLPDGSMQLLVQGIERGHIETITQEDPYYTGKVSLQLDTLERGKSTEALKRNLITAFQHLLSLLQSTQNTIPDGLLNVNEPREVVYTICVFLQAQISVELRQKILTLKSVQDKMRELQKYLSHEIEILELGKKIQSSAQEEMGKAQHEYMLREQMRAIQKELGEESEEQAAIHELREKIEAAKMPEEALKEAMRELNRLEKIPNISPEYSMIRTYIEMITSLPWSKGTGEQIDVPHARDILNQDHYDLVKVKDRILEYLAVRKLREDRLAEQNEIAAQEALDARATEEQQDISESENNTPPSPSPVEVHTPAKNAQERSREPILCFVGPPGVGKTSLGQSIARALGRKFARISLGGMHDEAEIRGHRRTYIGAMPGRILQTLRRLETNDPVIMLDEVDKVGSDWRGDPSSALLEVLDPEQNFNFHDNYLDLAFDLSKVMFIATANTLETIPAPLRDRMEILDISGYTEEQKLHIAMQYLLPKQLEANALKENELVTEEGVLREVIQNYTREAGVRNIERQIGTLCRKVARQITEEHTTPITITTKDIPEYLGRQRFFQELAERIDRPGIATGLAWTAVGGDILFIEATTMPAKEEKLILTGQLGDVMKESAQAALSYVRSNAEQLHLPEDVYTGQQIHIHIPEGATPKDGPSAGVTLVTVLVSLASGRKVHSDVAMTGEITLRGKVLPIGGIKEKVLAAYRAGIHTIILPVKNEAELLEDIPEELRKKMKFVFASDISDVLKAALQKS